MKKGFTLIELLIVIAIIGILASALLVSLGGARQSARDARRVSDMRQVQAALEVYYNKCGHYPGDTTCPGVGNPTLTWSGAAGTSGELDDILRGAQVGISGIPADPTGGAGQEYLYQVTTSNSRQGYVIRARLETSSSSLDPNGGDVDGSAVGGPPGVNCDDAPDRYYCLSI